MSQLGLTAKHIKEMKHMVGLDYKGPKRGKYEAYRNNAWYCSDNTPQVMLDLCAWGLVDYRATLEGKTSGRGFWLTRAGLDLLGEMIGAKITAR